VARFRKYTFRPRPVADINVVNLVDVTLVLLIIFIILAPFLKEGLSIRLPQVKVADRLGQQSLLIEMDQYEVLTLNGKPVAMDTLTARLVEERAAHPDWPTYVRTDAKNTVQNLADILSAIRAAGIDNMNLVTEEKPRS